MKNKALNKEFDYIAYSDGSCYPNDGTGAGGWGYIILDSGFNKIKEDC